MKSIIKKIIFPLVYYSGLSELYLLFTANRSRVIVYHRFRPSKEESNLSVSLATLARQLAYLAQRYQLVALRQVVDSLRKPNGKNLVAVTIDDGDAGLKDAWVSFKKFNCAPTLFLACDLAGHNSFLTWPEIDYLVKEGLAVESHTLSHPRLSRLSSREAAAEIIDSKTKLEARLTKTVHYFAYPYGKKDDYNRANAEQVKKAGYEAAFTIEEGTIQPKADHWQLNRIVVFDEPMFMFKVRVSGILDDLINLLKKIKETLAKAS